MSPAIITRALRDTGITSPADRRAFIEGKDLKEKVMRILENHPQLQEELAHNMGIGDGIIGRLHNVMEKDFQEPDTLLDELIEFFKTCGKLDLNIQGITTRGTCLFHTSNKQK